MEMKKVDLDNHVTHRVIQEESILDEDKLLNGDKNLEAEENYEYLFFKNNINFL